MDVLHVVFSFICQLDLGWFYFLTIMNDTALHNTMYDLYYICILYMYIYIYSVYSIWAILYMMIYIYEWNYIWMIYISDELYIIQTIYEWYISLSPLDCKEIQLVNPKGNQSWIFIGKTDAEAETPIFGHLIWKELTHLKRPWCWERLKVGGEGDDRGRDGWMASLTRWTWVWVNSRSWWWTGKPGVLQSMGSQRVRHDWGTELTEWYCNERG